MKEIDEKEAPAKSDSKKSVPGAPARAKPTKPLPKSPESKGKSNASDEPRPAVYGDWEEIFTEEGDLYYFNRVTNESA